MKKILVTLTLALFYAANVLYERGNLPDLGMPKVNLLTQLGTQNSDTQNTGIAAPSKSVVLAVGIANAKNVTKSQVIQQKNSPAPAAITQALPAPAPKLTTQAVPPPPPGQATPPPAASSPPPAATPPQGQYKNGSFTGTSEDAVYGFVQVQATVQGGRIVSVQFLSYATDLANSRQINSAAVPKLSQEAVTAQSANVQIVSGATLTSQAFIKSLSSALNQAKV